MKPGQRPDGPRRRSVHDRDGRGLPEVLGPERDPALPTGEPAGSADRPGAQETSTAPEVRNCLALQTGRSPGPGSCRFGSGVRDHVQVTNDGDVEATVPLAMAPAGWRTSTTGVPDETQVPIPIGGTVHL